MKNDCEKYVTYHKSNPTEFILVGDVVMLDTKSNTVTKAVAENIHEMAINSRLIVGVVVNSDNYAKLPIKIDGGFAKDEVDKPRLLIDCGTSEEKPEFILIEGGSSEQNKRELVQIAYSGEQIVNICGFVDLGDKLCISKHAGKAKAIDYIDNDYFRLRSIGKVIKFIDKYQAKVLLDIE